MRPRDAAAGLLMCLALGVATAAGAEEATYRFSAPISVDQPATFIQLPLPASAYGRSRQTALQDLRVVDARGERVPFAVLAPRVAELQTTEQQRDAALYPLPPKPVAGGAWPSPVEVTLQGDRISVKRVGGATVTAPDARSTGWLIDMGERQRDEPPPRSLRLQWSGPAEFSAAFGFETSDDLRTWRSGGSGQVLALVSAIGPLTQPTVMLPANAGRFVRLVWADGAAAPAVTGAKVVAAHQRSVALDAASELAFAHSPEPAGKARPDDASERALHFDLGGALPLVQIDLQLPPGTRVAPARLQARNRLDDAWRELPAHVFYRLERGAEVSSSPPLALHTTARYLRVIPDARAAALAAAQTKLVVHAQLASLVFAAQGETPFLLLAGSADARTSALPIATLVPALEDERARFGRATLGDWAEVTAVARAEASRAKLAAMRPWLLWAVLLAGVAGLAFMVWRLVRATPARQP